MPHLPHHHTRASVSPSVSVSVSDYGETNHMSVKRRVYPFDPLENLKQELIKSKNEHRASLQQLAMYSWGVEYLADNKKNFSFGCMQIIPEVPIVGAVLVLSLEFLDLLRKKVVLGIELGLDFKADLTLTSYEKQFDRLISDLRKDDEVDDEIQKTINAIQEELQKQKKELDKRAASNCRHVASVIIPVALSVLGFLDFIIIDKITRSVNDIWSHYDKFLYLSSLEVEIEQQLTDIDQKLFCSDIKSPDQKIARDVTMWFQKKLSSRIEEEKSRICFEKNVAIFRIMSSVIQLPLAFPSIKESVVGDIANVLFSSVFKTILRDSEILYMINPINPIPIKKFTVEKIAMFVVVHFREMKYSPNQCSFKAYVIRAKIEVLNSLEFCIPILFWVNSQLTLNCVQGLDKKRMSADSKKRSEEFKTFFNNKIDDLTFKLRQFRVKDANLEFPLENCIDAVEEANIDRFSKEELDYIESFCGYRLTNDSKNKFQEKMENFFILDRDNLLKALKENQLNFLKGISQEVY